MKLFKPAYYDKFTCIASACPDSCCKDWAVDVDDTAAAYYRSLPGDLGDRLRAVLQDTEDGTCMTIEDGRCPMWRTDGLCRLQAELGHDALCHTCRTFPRLRHDYGDFAELGLELSCPEAARLILTTPGDMACREVPGGEEADYDTEAMAILLRSRAELLTFLDSREYTVPQALAIALLYAHEVQAELDGGEKATLRPADALAEAARYATGGEASLLLGFFRELEILTPNWLERLNAASACISACHREGVTGPWRSVPPGPWQPAYRALAKYFVSRYWLQAVSDYDLVGRAKLTVAACLVIHALGGDLVQTAQAFSKEIENDPDNVEAILDGAYRSPALTDVQLLSLLLPTDN